LTDTIAFVFSPFTSPSPPPLPATTSLPVFFFSFSDADNFCDAMGELYDLMTAKGATVVGATSTDGYDHSETKSTRDGKFVGMPFDEDNQYDLSDDRAKSWIEQ
jgi:flavodoxin